MVVTGPAGGDDDDDDGEARARPRIEPDVAARWVAEQERLRRRLVLPGLPPAEAEAPGPTGPTLPGEGHQPNDAQGGPYDGPRGGDVVLGLDVHYAGETAHVAGVMQHWSGAGLGTFVGTTRTQVPYVPGLFCFREGPVLLALVAAIRAAGRPGPDVVLVDGHGVAHPRRFGIACWLGLAARVAAFGCAKDSLVPWSGELGAGRGSTVDVLVGGAVVGRVVRTQDGVRPVFVSPGHLVGLDGAVSMTLRLARQHRLPSLLSEADHAARAHGRGARGEWTDLGELPRAAPAWEESGA